MSRASDLRTLAVTALSGLLVLGCGDTPTEPRALSLTLSEPAVTIAQSASGAVIVTVHRTNFGGDVALAVSGAPTGVTASFTPASLAAGSSSSTLQLVVAADATPGPATILVTASGNGVAERSAALGLTIEANGSFALATVEGSLTVAQGGGGSATVLVNRVAGFAGNVALSVAGAPAGITAVVAPTSTAGNAVSLRLTAASSVRPGDYGLTITGASPGLSARTTSLSLAVIPPPSTSSVTFTFCSSSVPIWFAYQNEGYPWQQASPSGAAVTFAATEKVGVAWTYQWGSAVEVQVRYLTRAEHAALSRPEECPGDKSLTGSVAGLTVDQLAEMSMGTVGDVARADAPGFRLFGLPDRPLDLVAVRGSVSQESDALSFVPDTMIVRRGLSLTSGATIPVLDFTSGEAVAPATNVLGIAGLQPGESVDVVNRLWSATSTFGPLYVRTGSFAPLLYSLPASQLAPGDVQELSVDIYQTSLVRRSYVAYFGAPADRSDVPGPYVGTPEVTRLTESPHLRMRARVAAQPEYDALARVIFGGLGGANRNMRVLVTSAYLGGTPSTWDVVVPDLGVAPGFQASWMPTTREAPWVQLDVYSGLFRVHSHAGDLVRIATRVVPAPAGASPDARAMRASRRLMMDHSLTGAPVGSP